jgi:hypothetical protein
VLVTLGFQATRGMGTMRTAPEAPYKGRFFEK